MEPSTVARADVQDDAGSRIVVVGVAGASGGEAALRYAFEEARPAGDVARTGEIPEVLEEAAVDLYWLPLGAGGHFVRLNGRVFEALAARLQHRAPCDVYHSALEVHLSGGVRFVVEQAPVPDDRGADRGVVAEGSVGARRAGRLRVFRYEVRRWRDGVIPDVGEAVESPVRLSDEPDVAQRLWDEVPQIPTPVWGRDEFAAGEMWNSNSIISWLLTRVGLPVDDLHPPTGGRAPGWQAGIVAARRDL